MSYVIEEKYSEAMGALTGIYERRKQMFGELNMNNY